MIVDERVLTESLHGIDVTVRPDLAGQARRGGRRRQMRRRAYTAGGAVAVVAAAAPLTVALTGPSSPASGVKATASATPNPTPTGLFATPPPPGTVCYSNNGDLGPAFHPATYDPDLFLLPPHTPVLSAFYSAGPDVGPCPPSHNALTLLKQVGARITAGLVITGPNAPSARQDGYEGHDITFVGHKGHLPVQGDAAQEFTAGDASTSVFWTGKLGDQWLARTHGMSEQATVALLNQLQFDPHTGTARLPAATTDGWQVAPPAPDQTSTHAETFSAQWKNPSGVTIDLDTTTQPTDLDQEAAIAPDASITTVDGHPALLSYSTQFAVLNWQSSPHTWVRLMAEHGTTTDVTKAATTITLTPRNDPRIHHAG